MSLKALLVTFLLLGVLVLPQLVAHAAAEEESDDMSNEDYAGTEDDESFSMKDPNEITGLLARVYFPEQDLTLGAPTFAAGEKNVAYMAISNAAGNPTYNIFFAAGHISRPGDYTYHIQNFSGVHHTRSISGGESYTFRYDFKTDPQLDPMDYNLVLRLFFTNDANNTFQATAFNNTITVKEPSGFDPTEFFTVVLVLGMIGGAVYWFVVKKRKGRGSGGSKKAASGTATLGSNAALSYDPDFVPNDHKAYLEKLRTKSGSPQRK